MNKGGNVSSNAIYFPYINVPNNSWFLRILLYWDKVSSIVPYDYIENPNLLHPFMRDLISAELVDTIAPANYTFRIPNFEENFLQYIDYQLSIRRKFPNSYKTDYFLIHIDKIQNIGEELVSRGIAKRENYPWFNVEGWAANAFMSYLATCLGNEIKASPITPSFSNFGINFGIKSINNQNNYKIRSEIRHSFLKILLPEPSRMPTIDEIAKFKSENKVKLEICRRAIEENCIDIACITDRSLRNEKMCYAIKRIEDEVKEIDDAMKSQWQKTIFKVLIPLTIAELSLITGNLPALSAGILSLIQGIYLTNEEIKDFKKITDRPLAYIANVNKFLS